MKRQNFDYIQLKIAAPEDILEWSHGEVKKPETINYRTHRAELDGLMCEKIFGPVKDFECYCGKYKKYKYKGIICDKCGVEVTRKSVRRERMGHIRLATPVTHIWYSHGIPNKIAILLDIPQKKLQSVIYFSRYLVVESDADAKAASLEKVQEMIKEAVNEVEAEIDSKIKDEEKVLADDIEKYKSGGKADDLEIENLEYKSRLKIAKIKEEGLRKKNEAEAERKVLLDLVNKIEVGETVTEEEHVMLSDHEISFFDLKMGAEAIQYLLQKLNLIELLEQLHKDIKSTNIQKRLKAVQRLRYVNAFIKNDMKPEWMILEVVPVISPELRPIVSISGGRFATADLNDLYRRVINRNNRLKRLIELGAPDVILRNEKRMLQESVDALMDNSHRPTNAVLNKRRVPLKSLSDTLRGKQGRFRQNLLGKRVDYSGRAVIITAGRELKLNQCGIPSKMALELFKPFVIHKLIEKGVAANARSAKYMIESRDKSDEIWNVLDEVIQGHPVFLNRAPTFHKQSIQAFYPTLVSGESIRIHPLICEGFNADFDGDQMAIHIPLTEEAKQEAIELMMPEKNMLKSASGEFIMAPNRDLAQMIYYLSTFINEDSENLKVLRDTAQIYKAYQSGVLPLRQSVKTYHNGELIETSAGRVIFNDLLPESYPFVNEVVDRKRLKEITLDIVAKYPENEVVDTLNQINDVGFKFSTTSGFSIGLSDLVMLPDLEERIAEVVEKTNKINNHYKMGLLTEKEKSGKFADLWMREFIPEMEGTIKKFLHKENSLRAVADSGSRFRWDVVNQVVGVKGVVQNASQKIIELPILSNFLKGLTAYEYYIGTQGARKGLADTALRTADSGYLTRRLSDVAQDCIIREEDCGVDKGLFVTTADDKNRTLSYKERLFGRVPVADIKSKKGEVLAVAGEIISMESAKQIVDEGITSVEVRTALTCRVKFGICQKCYGLNYGTNKLVDIGTAVGIIAAQSAGELTSQLVLNTFHRGGKAGDDITMGMPRIQELFEARIPKGKAIICEIGGRIEIEETEENNVVKIKNEAMDTIEYPYSSEDKVVVKPKQKGVKGGDLLIITKDGEEIRSTRKGEIKLTETAVIIESNVVEEVEYKISKDEELLVLNGDKIEAGTPITHGNIDPRQLLQTKGITEAQKYIIDEIQRVYLVQGIPLGDKHLEVIITQMGRYVRITNPGDSELILGEIKDKNVIEEINDILISEGKRPVKYTQQLLGITAAALKTESFLSAASFQDQVRVLSDAAIMAKKDHLRGLKENVIIGKMIPVGKNALAKDEDDDEEIENEPKVNSDELKELMEDKK